MLHLAGMKLQDIYATLPEPTAPEGVVWNDCEVAVKKLDLYFEYKPNVTFERHAFRKLSQRAGETVSQFATRLREQAEFCKFDDSDEQIRDQLVERITDDRLREKLLGTSGLTLDKALEMARQFETTELSAKGMSSSASAFRVSSSNQKSRSVHTPVTKRIQCYNCGGDHKAKDESCPARGKECRRCHKTGHFAKKCRQKAPKSGGDTVAHVSSDQAVLAQDTRETMESTLQDSICSVTGNDTAVVVPVELAEVPVQMELDTGASVSIISRELYSEKLAQIPLQPHDQPLHAYDGGKLKVAGKISVPVKYEEQCHELPLVVVEATGNAPPLFGRNWLSAIRLDWQSLFPLRAHIFSIQKIADLEYWKSRFPRVFASGLGTVEGNKVTLHCKEDARPKFYKHRRVPYALQPAVERELARMEEDGVLKRVQFSEWATPLVCVPKADGSVRVCGDYKVTVNQAIHTDQFPIPTLDEAFGNLAGGQFFTKIDLKNAYQQLVLDEQSQILVTINTHKGLYRYTRLPFGVSSSPAIWQRFIDQAIAGLNMTCAIMDDVLVSGANDEEHHANVTRLLEHFDKLGLRVKPEKCKFHQAEVVYMGRRLSKDGVAPTDDHVQAIKEAPAPKNVSELKSWLGMVNFQGQFIPDLATMAHPLYELLSSRNEFVWSAECEKAWVAVKDAVCAATKLVHYDQIFLWCLLWMLPRLALVPRSCMCSLMTHVGLLPMPRAL